MEKSEYGVHITHCCNLHGCKYMDDDCPVVEGKVEQKYTCEYCSYDGLNSVEELKDYLNNIDSINSELAKFKEIDLNKNYEISGRLLKELLKKNNEF